MLLVMTLVVAAGIWEVAAPYAGDPWQAVVPNPELHLSADNARQISSLDASALLSRYAFADSKWANSAPQSNGIGGTGDTSGIPEKFDEGFYQKIQALATTPKHGDNARSAIPQYYDIVIVVSTHDQHGNDISSQSKAGVAAILAEAGARDVFVAESLPFLTASVPVSEINGLSLHGYVYLLGDGRIQASYAMDTARVTINATAASLGTANGTGVTVAVFDEFVNHQLLNDRTTHVSCKDIPCRILDNLADIPTPNKYPKSSHGASVASVIAASGLAANNGIATGVELISINLGQANTLYRALDWAVTHDAGVVNISLTYQSCGTLSHTSVIRVIVNDAVSKGLFIAASTGNAGGNSTAPTYGSVGSPACSENVVAAGGVNDRGNVIQMYTGSSRGPVLGNGTDPILKPEVVAPAVRLTIPAHYHANNTASSSSGTSFAAPQVAAAAAVLLGQDGTMDPDELRAAILLGADWKGPIPCTSVQYEKNNSSDNCSYAMQPSNVSAANDPASLGILNNVGFGILNVGQSMHYARQDGGNHILSGHIDAGQSKAYPLDVDASDTVKVILTWNDRVRIPILIDGARHSIIRPRRTSDLQSSALGRIRSRLTLTTRTKSLQSLRQTGPAPAQ